MKPVMYLIPNGSSLEGQPDHLGNIIGPRTGGLRPIKEGRRWAADNDAYHGKFTEQGFLKHLKRLEPYRTTCLFVALPDVVADPHATLKLYYPWRARVHALGFPVAWVAQNGATTIPDGCDAVFIGGTTEWKLGSEALRLCQQTKERGLWLHMGRVNSKLRSNIAAQMGVDSVDGTKMVYVGREAGAKLADDWMVSAKGAAKQQRLL